MFIFIPLILILASVLGIFIIVWRKVPHLSRMSLDETSQSLNQTKNGLLRDLFPEAIDGLRKFKNGLVDFKDNSLIETEKLLRRLRLVSLKVDRASDTLIRKIREGYQNDSEKPVPQSPGADDVFVTTELKPKNKAKKEVKIDTAELLRKEEQKLILEITKNPKDFNLYEVLGDLYVKMENFSDAKESYDAAVELNPQNSGLKKKLSLIVKKVKK